MRPTLNVKSWTPRFHPKPKSNGDGGYTSQFYEQHVLVTVFSYAGSDQHKAFTLLQAYSNNCCYEARLPKNYHPRWHARLARSFDWQIGQLGGGT